MGWSNAGWRSDQGGWYKNAAGGGTPTATYKNSATDAANNPTRTYSIDIGTASADRLVVVGVTSAATTPTSVTVNGVTLNVDVTNSNAGSSAGLYSALVTSGSGLRDIVVSGASVFSEVAVSVWVLTGLTSNVKKQVNSVVGVNDPVPISVAAGDFLFAMSFSTVGNASFASSTEFATAAIHNAGSGNPYGTSADWISVISTNAAFSVAPTSGNTNITAVASYR